MARRRSVLVEPRPKGFADGDNVVYLSAAAIWEIVIEQALGKLELPDDFPEALSGQSFTDLPVTANHALAVGELPLHHRDPFDRLLIAQCRVEGLTLISRDPNVKEYDIPVLEG